MALTDKAMLATLSIAVASMTGKDRQASFDANQLFQTPDAAGHYRKCKLERKDMYDILRTAEMARKMHREMTRPWGDNGQRLLPATLVIKATNEMRSAKTMFNGYVKDLQNRWPAVLSDRQAKLKGLFDPNDYPPQNKLPDLFQFEYKLRPVPYEGHIILALEAETIDELKQQLKEENQKNLENSKTELWARLFQPVNRMAEILGSDRKIYKSLIGNIEDVVAILPDLNVENNPDMAQMIREVRNKLIGHTPGQLRDDHVLKQNIAEEARSLAEQMDAYMQPKDGQS